MVYAGFDDWRLPVMVFPSPGTYVFGNNGTTTGGYGATGSGGGSTGDSDGLWSELGWMWYANLANLGYCTPANFSPTSCDVQSGRGLVDDAANPNDESLFGGTIQSSAYWSGTEYAPSPGFAWGFGTINGFQGNDVKGSSFYAWAVRPEG